jgi:hypothetical protein
MTQHRQVNEPRHLPAGGEEWEENRSDRNYMLSARFHAFAAMQMRVALLWVVRRRLTWGRRFEASSRCQPSGVKCQWETNPRLLGQFETRNGKNTMSRNVGAKSTYNPLMDVLNLEEGTDILSWTVHDRTTYDFLIIVITEDDTCSAFGKSLCTYKSCWKWCPRASVQAWTRLILFANTFRRSAFGKSLYTYKSCWKWYPRASIQAWTYLILFSNTFRRSACEMFLMIAVIAVFNWLSVLGLSLLGTGVLGNYSANCCCTKSLFLLPSRKTYSTRKHVPHLK